MPTTHRQHPQDHRPRQRRALFLYAGASGFSYAVTMDQNHTLRWVGQVNNMPAGQLITTAGGR